MKVIILGAGQGTTDGTNVKIHKALFEDIAGKRILDWILNSFSQLSIEDFVFIAGYQAERVMKLYPNIRYYLNKDWEKTNMLYSLMSAEKELNDDVIVSYSDIIFHSNICKAMIASTEDIAILVDTAWQKKYQGLAGYNLLKAEKVVANNGYVKKIGKNLPLTDEITGEFIGLCKFSRKGMIYLKRKYAQLQDKSDIPIQESANLKQAYLTDILQEMVESGIKIKVIECIGGWVSLDETKDLSQFIFGTKGETLERLKPLLKTAKICDQILFEVQHWEESKEYYIKLIQNVFKNTVVIIRSSTLLEDTSERSYAGSFKSVSNVNTANSQDIIDGINKVIKSYANIKEAAVNNKYHQILIQPQINNISISGVILTRDMETGAPYYSINFDENESRTDTVTSGTNNFKCFIVFKNKVNSIKDKNIRQLLIAVEDIIQLIGNDSLDIEFAITNEGIVYIFQVRPITTLKNKRLIDPREIENELHYAKSFIQSCDDKKTTNLYGCYTILANMPDWNPAELIGTHPKPLAYSLYEYLITSDAWREARARIGYNNPYPSALMVSLFGQPYIDVRVSFNTLLPNSIPDILANKLINFYLKRLKDNPELHDKIEFDIMPTCYSFDFSRFEKLFLENGFTKSEIDYYKQALLKLTNNIISKPASLSKELKKVDKLKERRNKLLAIDKNNINNLPYIIKVLLEDCKEYGVKPFSILARYAFIAMSFLKDLVNLQIFTEDEFQTFLESIETVAGRTMKDLEKVRHGQIPKDFFLQKYGHLRPGTYDITSPRYDEQPDMYFNIFTVEKEIKHNSIKINKKTFSLTEIQREKINKLIEELNYSFNADQLLKFISSSISAREYAKFEFTKNLSDALVLIEKFAHKCNIAKNDIAYLPICNIINHANKVIYTYVIDELARQIQIYKEAYQMTKILKFPHIITTIEDTDSFIVKPNVPNYITNKHIAGELHYLDDNNDNQNNLDRKIVAIECADPGYDWIFSYNILGLVTKYGGANSHMAIRCAEFNIPAAIGCGELLFNKIINTSIIELNCGAKYVNQL